MEIGRHLNCCGLNEIMSLSSNKTPEAALRKFVKDTCYTETTNYSARPTPGRFGGLRYPVIIAPRTKLTGAHFIFTQAGKRARYGIRFAKLIKDLDLGYLEETVWMKNPNSGHQVKCWVWTPSMDALVKWYEGDQKDDSSTEVKQG